MSQGVRRGLEKSKLELTNVTVEIALADIVRRPQTLGEVGAIAGKVVFECPVCQEKGTLHVSEAVCRSCRKAFCGRCVREHLLKSPNKNCPTCRADWSKAMDPGRAAPVRRARSPVTPFEVSDEEYIPNE